MCPAEAGPLEAGQYEQVITTTRKILEAKPGALPIYTRLGIALSRAGNYDAAIDAFERGGPNPYYMVHGFSDHANAFRGLRDCERAVALRREMLGSLEDWQSGPSAVDVYVDLVDDWLACGRLEEAEEVAFEGMLAGDAVGTLHATLADVYLARGELGRSDFHLREANLAAPRSSRTLLATLNASSTGKDWLEVSTGTVALAQRAPRHPALFVSTIRSLTFRGQWREALQFCSSAAWADHEDHLVASLREAVLTYMGQEQLVQRNRAGKALGWRR